MFVKLEWIYRSIAFIVGFITCSIVSHIGLIWLISLTLLAIVAFGYIRQWCREGMKGRILTKLSQLWDWLTFHGADSEDTPSRRSK
jgi:hypothetical protein